MFKEKSLQSTILRVSGTPPRILHTPLVFLLWWMYQNSHWCSHHMRWQFRQQPDQIKKETKVRIGRSSRQQYCEGWRREAEGRTKKFSPLFLGYNQEARQAGSLAIVVLLILIPARLLIQVVSYFKFVKLRKAWRTIVTCRMSAEFTQVTKSCLLSAFVFEVFLVSQGRSYGGGGILGCS